MPQPHEQKLQEVVNSLTFDELHVRGRGAHGANVEEPAKRQPGSATESQPEQIAAANR